MNRIRHRPTAGIVALVSALLFQPAAAIAADLDLPGAIQALADNSAEDTNARSAAVKKFVAKAGAVAIGSGPGAAVLVENSSFSDGDEGAVSQGALTLTVSSCSFQGINHPVQGPGGGTHVAVTDCSAVAPAGAEPAGFALQFDGGGCATIRGNRLTSFEQAITLAGQWEQAAAIEENVIANPTEPTPPCRGSGGDRPTVTVSPVHHLMPGCWSPLPVAA